MTKLGIRLAFSAAATVFGLLMGSAFAQDATWTGSGEWTTPGNWSPATLPAGTATFANTGSTTVANAGGSVSLGEILITAGAPAYTFNIDNAFTLTGTGVVNNSTNAPTFNVSAGQTLTFQNGASASAGTGAATGISDASGIVNFDNASTAGNASIGNGNLLNFNDSSSAGSATIGSTGVIDFNNSATAAAAQIFVVSGQLNFNNTSTAGSAQIVNFDTTTFNQSASAGNASITNYSNVTFNDTSTAGTATITSTGNEVVHFNGSSTAGSATLINASGGGILYFNDSSTAGNATINNNGSLFFADMSTAGNATIETGRLGFTLFQDTSTGGNARLIVDAGGIFQVGTNSNFTAGSIEGAGGFVFYPYNYSYNGLSVTVGSNNLSTSVGGIFDGGDFIKVGTGTLTLAVGGSVYGATIVNAGTLQVDGYLQGFNGVTVNSGAALSGTGLIGIGYVTPMQVNAGATLAPGNAANPTGTLSVYGNLAFSSGAFYLVQVSGANAGQTTVYYGTATLAGTVEVGVVGSVKANTSYDILHADSGLGGTTFSGVQSPLPGFAAALSYSATDVFLNFTAILGSSGGLNAGQQHVASGLNSAFNSGASLPAAFLNLFQLSGASLSSALTQISGETATGSQQTTFGAMGQFMGMMTDPFLGRGGGINGSNAAQGYAATSNPTDAFAMFTKAAPQSGAGFEQRWNVWASAFGGSQGTEGNAAAGTNNTSSNIFGTAVGADYRVSANTLVGFALAGGGTNFAVVNGGTGRSDLFQFGTYVRHTSGPAYITGALAYGWQDITTNRTVTVAGFDQLRAQFDANSWSGRVEGGYRFVSPATLGVGITPYAAAQFVSFDLPAYAEQAIVGSNTFALSYGAQDATDVRSELGVRADKSWVVTEGLLTLRGRLAWAHDYDPNRSISATFQSLPGASFVVNGAAQAADSALATAAIEVKWRSGWSAAATFEGEFSNVTSSYAGKGVVRYVW